MTALALLVQRRLMAFEKLGERGAIPFARGQEERVFGGGVIAFVSHRTSLAQLRAKTFLSFVCAIGGSGFGERWRPRSDRVTLCMSAGYPPGHGPC